MTMLVALAAAAVGASWSPLGNPISGDSNDMGFGASISMSSDGEKVLVGGNDVPTPHLYSWASPAWSDTGEYMGGSGKCDVALSGNGLVMAIAYAHTGGDFHFNGLSGGTLTTGSGALAAGGVACTAATNNDGRVMVFGYCTRGNNGEVAGVKRATSSHPGGYYHGDTVTNIYIIDENVTGPFTVAVSAGSTVDDIYVAVGAPTAYGGQGAAFVFRSNDGGSFVQLGSKAIMNKLEKNREVGMYDEIGTSVALAGDAASMIIAVGSPGTNASAGRVYLLTVRANITTNVEDSHLVGDLQDDKFGTSVALSDDGATLVVGAPQDSAGYGYARVYRNSTGTSLDPVYAQLEDGSPVGTDAGSLFGTTVAISGSGDRIAVGAPGNLNGEVTAWGYVTTTTTTTTTITTTTTTTTTVIMAIIITLYGDLGQMSPQNTTDLTNAISAYLQSKNVTVTNVTLVSGSIVATATLGPSTTGSELESLESAVQADIASGIPVGGLQMLDVSTSGGDPPATTSNEPSTANIGAIIGGSVGGVALIAAAVYFLWRNRGGQGDASTGGSGSTGSQPLLARTAAVRGQ